ncbi:MAG TPA: PhzF family phenazine biosynthesis protein [Candidatus Kapabacteria bacterium]|nr:PhzF family phenazine biosynthesis protein [Candidatus Kapabacteria bacterium]
MAIPISHIDAFTQEAFSGNPAAVCLLNDQAGEQWMQSLAAEMNLAETAFVQAKDGEYGLRWFTPTVEVDLCGHATLAAAHMLWEEGHVPPEIPIRFNTRSGLLTAMRDGDTIVLNFPAEPEAPMDPPALLAEALGAEPQYVGRNRMDILVEVAAEDVLRSLAPDFAALAKLPARGLIVTCQSSTPGYHFISRFFAPASGIDEDPVTGSAHCCLAPFWGRRLGLTNLTAYQASPRGGVVHMRLDGDRVLLAGSAVTVVSGTLRI